MTNDDQNNSPEQEEDHTNYKHAASEIDALRAILKKRKNNDKTTITEKDENKDRFDKKGEEASTRNS